MERLEGIIHREQDAIRPHLAHAEIERRGREMPRGGNPNVLGKVLTDGLFAIQTQGFLDVLKPVIDAPQVKGDVFAEMADDHFEVGVAVEDAVGDHAENMEGDALGEAEGWADEPGALGPEFLVDGAGRVTGVEVEWDVEFGAGFPEDVPFFAVVEDHIVAVGAASLGVVDEGAFETEFRLL